MSHVKPITKLLQAAGDGDPEAVHRLLPLVYEELRSLARAHVARSGSAQTLQATALLHEVYLRVAPDGEMSFANRRHFFYVAARAMHDILVENARRKAAVKRGGDRARVSAENLDVAIEAPAEDMLGLEEALERLERDYPRQHQLVMLRFFAGFTEIEAAEVMGIDPRTARRDWRFVRAWLHASLEKPRS